MNEEGVLIFNGSEEISIQQLFNETPNSFTYEFWIKPEAEILTIPEAVSGIHGIKGQQWVIGAGHGGLNRTIAGTGISVGTNGIAVFEHCHNHFPALLVHQIEISNWMHIVIVFDKKIPKLYINGTYVKMGIKSTIQNIYPSGIIGFLGKYGHFQGQLKKIKIWNYSRTNEQIIESMNSKNDDDVIGLLYSSSKMNWDTKWRKSPAEKVIIKEFKVQTIDTILEQLTNPINIILPVYNAFECLVKCIESIQENTSIPYQIIVINDCSSDTSVTNYLLSLKTKKVKVIHNSTNKGFVETINIGINSCKGDVILLNSDTIVTPRWAQKLLISAYSNKKIGTVTPFSNAAGAFSVPYLGLDNPIPAHLTINAMSRLVEINANHEMHEVPTGNGFCMYIKREVFNEIGLFDVKHFHRGYGEENDFCMRALKKGWINIIDDSTFIYHKTSASFQSEKQELMKKNREVLDRLHPEYSRLVKEFISSTRLAGIRETIKQNIKDTRDEILFDKKRVLYILHQGSGGTPNSNRDLMAYTSKNYQCFLLTSDRKHIYLWEYINGILQKKSTWSLQTKWEVSHFYSDEFKELYFNLLIHLKIDLVHIRHLIGHTFDLPVICHSLGIKVILSFHDFYYVCPTVNLLDSHLTYCAGKCTHDWIDCPLPVGWKDSIPQLKHKWVYVWRNEVRKMFQYVSVFITTSFTTKTIYINSFPELKSRNFVIIEHGRDFKTQINHPLYCVPESYKKIKILIPGNIGVHKGIDFIISLQKADVENRFEFHFLGQVGGQLRAHFNQLGIFHGPYERDEIFAKIKEINPSFIGIFSITPETYCHTLTEAWMARIPVLASKIGTIEERIKKHNGGFFIDIHNPQKSYQLILDLTSNKQKYMNLVENIKKIKIKTLTETGKEYDFIYRKLISNSTIPRVGIITKGGASTHIRLFLPLFHNSLRFKLFPEIIRIHNSTSDDSFFLNDIKKFTAIIVQRTGLTLESAKKIKNTCDTFGVKLIYEMDDDLIHMDEKHKDFKFFNQQREIIIYLLKNAHLVTVTSEHLKERLTSYNQNIKVISNYLDERLWLTPLEGSLQSFSNQSVLIGFVGSFHHSEDLNLLKPAINNVLKWGVIHNLEIQFYVVGGEETEISSWYKRIVVPKEEIDYPKFVKWLRKNVHFTIGVAPLTPNLLNQSKSYLKYLDYAALGIPGVYSELEPYKKVISSDFNGLLAKHSVKDWENHLKRLIMNPSLREEIIQNSYQDIVNNHLLKEHTQKWLEIISD